MDSVRKDPREGGKGGGGERGRGRGGEEKRGRKEEGIRKEDGR